MKRIRIGKDINVQWVLRAPADVVLTSENLTIELKEPKGKCVEVDTFTLEGLADSRYAVHFALRGTAFSQLGNYTFTAWLNKGEQGQSAVDAVNAFTLVGSTQAEGDSQSRGCGCLNLATIDLQGDISFVGQSGYSPTANVVKEGDTATITITDKDGTTTATVKDGKDGDDGISPIAEVSKSGSVVTISITDKEGTHTTTVRDGIDGNDGTSPTVSISKSGDTTTIAITDRTGTHTAEIKDGVKGDDGVSPAVMVESITGGHQVTITDAEHPQGQSFDVMDGQDAPAVTEIFWATYGTTTATEIQTALDAGKVVMCKSGTFIYTLTDNNDILFKFFSFYNICTFKSFSVTKSDSVWSKIDTYSSLLTGDRIASTATTTPSDIMVYSALATKNLVDTVDAKIGQSVSFTFTYEDDTTQTYNLLTSNT